MRIRRLSVRVLPPRERSEMWCPKCNAISDERFCRQCGSDLQIYTDLQALRSEVDLLRQLVLFGSPSKPEIDPGLES